MILLDRLIEQQEMRVECRCTTLNKEELKHFENDILEALEELKRYRSQDLTRCEDIKEYIHLSKPELCRVECKDCSCREVCSYVNKE